MVAKKTASKAGLKKTTRKAPVAKATPRAASSEGKASVLKFDIIRDGNVYIRTLVRKAAHAFVEKENAKAVAHASVVGRKSYRKCEAVPTSENKRFVVRYSVHVTNDETGERELVAKTKVFTKRQVALDFAHQIPNTPVTLR